MDWRRGAVCIHLSRSGRQAAKDNSESPIGFAFDSGLDDKSAAAAALQLRSPRFYGLK